MDILDRLKVAKLGYGHDLRLFGEASDEIARLRAEVDSLTMELATAVQNGEALRVDAERYRWLRDKVRNQNLVIAKVGTWSLDSWSGDNTDVAIDAARGKDNG